MSQSQDKFIKSAVTRARKLFNSDIMTLSELVNISCTAYEAALASHNRHKVVNEQDVELRAAAIAVVERWDSQKWKDLPHTAQYIHRLCSALSQSAKGE